MRAIGGSGMVLVQTSSLIGDLSMRSSAGPDSTPCVQHAYTAVAPFSTSAVAALQMWPAVCYHVVDQQRALAAHVAILCTQERHEPAQILGILCVVHLATPFFSSSYQRRATRSAMLVSILQSD